MRTGAVIQARMSSERMPGKVMADLPFDSGIPSIVHVLRRVKAASRTEVVVLATSEGDEDRVLLELAEREGVIGFAGDLDDVLDRFHQAAAEHHLDQIVRITGDCPCLDPALIDRVIGHHLESGADFTSLGIGRTYPAGMDTAVITREALSSAWSQARRPEDREHVTSFFYQTAPDDFTIEVPLADAPQRRPDIRVTLDTPRDYALLCIVFEALYGEDTLFGLDQIIGLFDAHPWLVRLNTVTGDLEAAGEAIAWCRDRGRPEIARLFENGTDPVPGVS
jgi:spore coat polysaccharide biosynthesis protein SpsF